MMPRVLFLLSVVTIGGLGCKDDRPPGTSLVAPAGGVLVAGSQGARSGSFMLVSNVSVSDQPVATGATVVLKSGLGAQ